MMANNSRWSSSDRFQKHTRVDVENIVVLNDPQKRENYDTYGVADLEGIDLEEFMSSFGGFD